MRGRDVDLQALLTAVEGAEVRNHPVQIDQLQQALDEPGRLAKRDAEKHLDRQAGLDRRIALVGLSAAFASRRGFPRSWRDRTSLTAIEGNRLPANGSSASHGASAHHCRPGSSWSCRRGVQVCSRRPATTRESQDESLTGFVQQSPATTYWLATRSFGPGGSA